jgi:flagellar basal-body rod protein FlgB
MPALLDLAAGAARHAARRSAVVANNVANADTPGFRAMDVAPFSPEARAAMPMRVTRPGHLGGAGGGAEARVVRDAVADPNGNTVTLEDQVLRGIEAERAHGRAVTIYSTSLDILRAGLGRR